MRYEFDILYKINNEDFGVGMVYPSEYDRGFHTLWKAHHHWNPKEMTLKEFLFDYEDRAYEDLVQENVMSDSLELFAEYYCRDINPNATKIYATLEEALEKMKDGDFAIITTFATL